MNFQEHKCKLDILGIEKQLKTDTQAITSPTTGKFSQKINQQIQLNTTQESKQQNPEIKGELNKTQITQTKNTTLKLKLKQFAAQCEMAQMRPSTPNLRP